MDRDATHSREVRAKISANSTRYAAACKSGVAKQNFDRYGERTPYCPSPEEIEAGCKLERERWSEDEHRRRAGQEPHTAYTIPGVPDFFPDSRPIECWGGGEDKSDVEREQEA